MKRFVQFAIVLVVPALSFAQKGTITEITIPSKTQPAGRHASVYTPAGYPASCQSSCNLIIALDRKGYSVAYFEVPNGQHSPDSWRARLPIGIVALAPSDR